MIELVSGLAVAIVATVALLILFGTHAAAKRADLSPAPVTRKAALVFGGWLAVTAALAASGVLENFEARPPRMMLVIVGSLVVFTLTTRAAVVRRLLDAAPRWWIVALQTMRIPIELGLFSLFRLGRVPEHMTFDGRNFDILVGLTAPFVAFGIARGVLGRRALLAWNVVSLALLANVVGMALTSMPGPFQLSWPGPMPTVVGSWPFVWLPSFLVPVALFGHILSLRQVLGQPRAEAGDFRHLPS